jgi:EmrB/QacA subfamily drug resistance transporter
MQPGPIRRRVTAAILLGMFLAALEATAVAAAVPTAVGELGGVARYSWVFSAYLLTSTATVPLFGKLADLFGRKKIYQVSVFFFLLGSALSGLAHTFPQLVVFRAVQGLGAGGVMPVAVTITGDIFSLEERARVQGLFSGVWATASLVGPLLGGLITDLLSWRWIFFLNIPFGLLSAWMLQRSLREEVPKRKVKLDVLGTVALTGAVTALLLGLLEGSEVWGWGDPRTVSLFAVALAGFALFLWQERRAPEPMLPLDLFRSRLISAASAGNVLIGALLFCLTAYVPMLGQAVFGGSAMDAGWLLMPVLIGWPIASTLGGRFLMRIGYRTMALAGQLIGIASAALLVWAAARGERGAIQLAVFGIGLGLGFSSMPYLLGPQNAVAWHRRGVATSSVQFFRNIGGAVAVAAAGALFNARWRTLAGPGADANAALDPVLRHALAPHALARLTHAMQSGITGVFAGLLGLGGLGLLVAYAMPKGGAQAHVHPERDGGHGATLPVELGD